MRRHYQSALNDELVNATSVLLELLFIRDGAYSLSNSRTIILFVAFLVSR